MAELLLLQLRLFGVPPGVFGLLGRCFDMHCLKLANVQRTNGLSVAVYSAAGSGDYCAALVPNKTEADLMVGSNAMSLSMGDGAVVAAAICSVWFAAWAIRATFFVLKDRDQE